MGKTQTPMTKADPIDEYIAKRPKWNKELTCLRKILKASELEETLKWGAPIYTIDGKNVVGLLGFKEHVALWFHQGVFLKDRSGKLVNAQEGTTKAQRQWRISANDEIDGKLVNSYVEEAIANQKAGKVIKPEKSVLVMPEELRLALGKDSKLKIKFDRLSIGKQKEYAEHIGGAKQEKTRISRLEKALPLIMGGGGLYDKYKQ